MFGQTNRLPFVNSVKLPNYFTVSADFASATWNTVASHEVATVTGLVHMIILPQCTETLTDAADLATIQLGVEGSTAALIAATSAAGLAASTISATELWVDATPADLVATRSQFNALDFFVGSGLDVGYEIGGQALTDGTIVFHIWWEAIDSTGAVTAGAGGSL